MNPSIAIVILNWNNAQDTVACLDSLARLDCLDCRVVVVDNGSTDDSVDQILASFPNVQLLETGENLGYAGGNNVGIRQALAGGAEAVCILNNDIVVEPDFMAPLLMALTELPRVGVVTPLIAERIGGDGCVWTLGSSVDQHTASVTRRHAGQPIAAWRQQAPFEVEAASGAAMLVKREVFERVGLMDESFFLYFEEVDWSLNVRQAGYRILAVPSSVVWHKVSATLGTSSPVIDYYMLRNHLRLIDRHWKGPRRPYLKTRVALRNLATIAAYTANSHNGQRVPSRNARLLALRDAMVGRWGKMGVDVEKICYSSR